MLADLKAAWRSLLKSPGFAAVAILALGLGLALSTTMFGVIDAVLNPQSPYRNADRLRWVSYRMSYGTRSFNPSEMAAIIRQQTNVFDASLVERSTGVPASVGPGAREFPTTAVEPEWFGIVGVRPLLGRTFAPADGDRVALVNEGVWHVISGGRRTLAGAHIVVGGGIVRVLGVLPRGAPPVVVPLSPADARSLQGLPEFRLAPGVTDERARAELSALARTLTARYGSPDAPWSLNLHSLWRPAQQVDDVHKAMVLAALTVLLIACVNLAHLMLARGHARRRELAIRMALGARRAAAVRLVLAESAMVLAGGVALGALGATWASHVAENALPADISWVSGIQFQLSWRVFALGAAAAIVAGVLFGLLPAIRIATSVDLTDPLKTESGTTTGQRRWRYSPLVITEVALALALLMAGGLLLRSVRQLRSTPQGFDAATLIQADIYSSFTIRGRPGSRATDTVAVDWGAALAAARSVSGVQDAAIEGQDRTRGGAVTAELTSDTTRVINGLSYDVVSPSFLRVYGLPVLKGRDFAAGDVAGSGVAILSTVAAARLYPKENPVGHMLKLGSPRAAAPWIPIVGVARTPIFPWRESSLTGGDPVFWVVRPPSHWPSATLLIRTERRTPQVLIALRQTLRGLPNARSVGVEPFDWQRDAEIASRDFLATVFVAMGGVGLALAALGLYGVLAYAVTRRMREFAVRIALGAEPRVLYGMVMHDGLVMLLAGTGAGAFLALVSSYLLNAVLIGVYPTDALSLVASEAVLLVVGLAAALTPARRAVRANPLDILRAV